jgi:hypothetical protein
MNEVITQVNRRSWGQAPSEKHVSKFPRICTMQNVQANKISVLLNFGVKQKPPTDKIPFINK